ncbi:MAG: SCO family protein [Chloroflexi bacterium]|nr:SCO family protein [Chloroflexota bacterium]
MSRWRLLYALAALPVIAVIAFATLRPIQVLPRITLSPGFSLTDQNNARLTNEDLRGRITLYNFTYANCAAPCPQTSSVFRALQTELRATDTNGIPVSLVTISFDPERDTPEKLHAYAAQVGADSSVWRIATGDATRLKYALGGGFGLYYARNADGAFTFDPLFVLVDGWGIIRAYYKTATPTTDRLARDIRLIAQEARNSEGAARYAYEAAHLFLCYPP